MKISALRRLGGVRVGLGTIALSLVVLGLVDAVAILPLAVLLAAAMFLFGCWSSRALASTVLLSALGVAFSPRLALVVLCMSAAASLIPLTAGGAIAGIGASAGMLVLLGVPHEAAVNFSLASGLLRTTTALAAAAFGLTASLVRARRSAGSVADCGVSCGLFAERSQDELVRGASTRTALPAPPSRRSLLRLKTIESECGPANAFPTRS